MIAGIRDLRLFAVLVIIILLAGCAFGTRSPTLIYPPKSESDAVPAVHARVAPASRNVQVILNPFTDQRSDKKLVGTVRNAFGMRTADVIPTNDVSEWVTQAMRMELENNGYSVVNTQPAGGMPGTSIVVSGDILNVFCDMYFTYTGQVALITRVSRGGKELLSKHYAGEGSAGLAVAMTGESYAQSLALALAAALKQFISDLSGSLPAE